MSPHEFFEHTADLGLRATAPDLDGLFREAADALFAAIVEGQSATSAPVERVELALAGSRLDWLLFDWLSELLYLFESRRIVLADFEVQVGAEGLSASASARPFVPHPERPAREVKAITYHGLKVERTAEGGWLAEVIVDI